MAVKWTPSRPFDDWFVRETFMPNCFRPIARILLRSNIHTPSEPVALWCDVQKFFYRVRSKTPKENRFQGVNRSDTRFSVDHRLFCGGWTPGFNGPSPCALSPGHASQLFCLSSRRQQNLPPCRPPVDSESA